MARSVAVITGASSGIGLVFARRLAAEYDLLLVARRGDRLEAIASELATASGVRVEILAADLTDEHGLSAVAERIAAVERLGLLVNNAGFGAGGPFWETELGVHEEMHRLHVMATVRLCHVALKKMVAQDAGGVINVASVAAFISRGGSASYGSTKCWMAAFSESLWQDVQNAGAKVTVQALCPGYTYSEFHDTMGVNRKTLAGPKFWLSAEEVVDASLRGLKTGKLYVVPGWRYGLLVAVISKLPIKMRLALVAGGLRRLRGGKT